MKVVTPSQMNEIDAKCIKDIGIPGVVLMENAALGVVEWIERDAAGVIGKNIVVVAGKGNNGGDGFAAARHLKNRGAAVKVFLFGEEKDVSGDAAINLKILHSIGIQVNKLVDDEGFELLKKELVSAHVVVDAILGTGIKREVSGLAAKVIELINSSGAMVIAVDIPSGISGESGKVMGCAVKADRTVTFALPKPGLLIHPGCEYTGKLVVHDIGVPEVVVDGMDIRMNVIDEEHAALLVPKRKSNSNKGDYGKVFVITGSVGMTGSGCMAGEAALRTGAGLIYLGVPSALSSIYDAYLTEAVTIPLSDNGKGYLAPESADEILEHLKKYTAAAIGPGLSTKDGISDVVFKVIENSGIPLILDADALNAVAKDPSVLKKLKSQAVITPHPGEMSRLMGISVKEVQYNRIEIARKFAKEWDVITVLKGAGTIIAIPDGTIYINTTGNAGMATGGTGDVLAGIIAGLAAQGLKAADAAVLGVYLHGLAGDAAAGIKGMHGMTARDMLECLPYVMKQLAEH